MHIHINLQINNWITRKREIIWSLGLKELRGFRVIPMLFYVHLDKKKRREGEKNYSIIDHVHNKISTFQVLSSIDSE